MSSKFANLLSQARNRPSDESEPEVEQGSEPATVAEVEQPPVASMATPSIARPKSGPPKATSTARPKSSPAKLEPEAAARALRGRPRTGKRSDPNYTPITAYITKKTHRNVKLALLQEDNGRELSEIVEELLAAWIEEQK